MKLRSLMELRDLDQDWKVAHVVYSKDNWDVEYSLESRTYEISSSANYFDSSKISKSIYGDSLDGSDLGVRLDLYNWEVDEIIIVE